MANNLFLKKIITDEIIRKLNLGDVFIHKEESKMLQSFDFKELPISTTFYIHPSDIDEICTMFIGLEEKFVILPAYTKDDIITDFQLAVTGSCQNLSKYKCKTNEFKTTSIRETAEEIGINTHDGKFKTRKFIFGDITTCVQIIELDTIKKSQPIKNKNKNSKYDNKKFKVMSWIIFNNPSDIIIRNRTKSVDIAGKYVVVIRIRDLIKLIKFLVTYPIEPPIPSPIINISVVMQQPPIPSPIININAVMQQPPIYDMRLAYMYQPWIHPIYMYPGYIHPSYTYPNYIYTTYMHPPG